MQKNEEEMNQEKTQSRKELEALKQLVKERLEAELKTTQQGTPGQERYQETPKNPLAQHQDGDNSKTIQQTPQTGVSLAPDAMRLRDIEKEKARLQKLKEIQRQLELLERNGADYSEAQQGTDILPPTSPDKKQDTPNAVPQQASDSQLFSLNAAYKDVKQSTLQESVMKRAPQPPQPQSHIEPPKTTPQQTQLQNQNEALKIALQQSQPQTQKEALKIAQQQSQRQTQKEALIIAQQQSQRQTQKEASQILEGSLQSPVIPSPTNETDSDPGPLLDMDEDDVDSMIEEIYPKPKDTAFVFPDQSVSIIIKRRRSPFKMLLAGGLLLFVAAAGIGAFMAYRILLKPAPVITAPSASAEKREVKMLRLEFPTTKSFGTLYDTSTEPTSDTEWQPYADARGVVEYPDTMKLHLVVRREHAHDLSPLTKLPPKSITSLRLPLFDMSDMNLKALHSLERVDLIYIDQEMTARERDHIASGFKGDVAVTSKIPGTIVRDMTPPEKRTVVFPEDVAAGRLAIRRWNDPSAPWQYLEIARGSVEIPARMEVLLQIGTNTSSLPFLKGFDETVIHTLVLEGQHITDSTMADAAVLRGLVALELINTRISKTGMEEIGNIQGLQQIKIQDTRLDDDGLLVLRDLPQLSTIEIRNAPNITAKSFALFKSLLALRRLHLQNTAITPEQLRQLERDLLSCAITSF